MSRKVTFLGFWIHDTIGLDLKGREIWTLNDWYAFYPQILRPARVYQMHEGFTGPSPDDTLSGRFPGNWRDRYEWSGSEIVTLSDMGFSKQRIMDKAGLVREFGEGFFGSTFSYMFADAIREKVDAVEMVGARLKKHCEHEVQIPVTLYNIEAARAAGIEVVARHESTWRREGGKPGKSPKMYGVAHG